jgi:hypothetical protein
MHNRDIAMAGVPQSGLDDRGPDAVLVDNKDGQRTGGHAPIVQAGRICAMWVSPWRFERPDPWALHEG